ncbi:MAG TPA: hypothetical protein VMV92_03030 [Streptosporangiaceae bacterium]|nr:hypothetical protein [Streptosporangiaceae bacterium]
MTIPSLPIPNDDPRCRCQLSPDSVPRGATMMTGWSGIPGTPEATLALYADCVHHGSIARAFTEPSQSGFSLRAP